MNPYKILVRFRDYLRELEVNKKRRNIKLSFNDDFNRELWRLTYTLIGVESKQTLFCPHCFVNNNVREEMILRKSQMSVDAELGYRNQHFDLHYKCPRCGHNANVFGIAVPLEHFLRIKLLRKSMGVGLVYAPESLWKNNRSIKSRLKALGYW